MAKKNKAILERLEGWLRMRNADREGRIDVPLLLIDDEADNASVNTRRIEDPTSINRAIRGLLGLFRRSTYVGFTATPFANIFIDPETRTEMEGDDLFPNDFIHVLEAPGNYVGMDRLFAALDPEVEASGDEPDGPLRPIEDAENWLQPGEKGEADPDHLPDSLVDALRTFLLACAVDHHANEARFGLLADELGVGPVVEVAQRSHRRRPIRASHRGRAAFGLPRACGRERAARDPPYLRHDRAAEGIVYSHRSMCLHMRDIPVNDFATKNGRLRIDGKLERDLYPAASMSPPCAILGIER